MVIAIDIDGVLTNETEGHGYNDRTPNKENIEKVNALYGDGTGDCIVLYTARWACDTVITKNWLKYHNVKYHELVMDKLKYDVLVDDRAFNNFKQLEKHMKKRNIKSSKKEFKEHNKGKEDELKTLSKKMKKEKIDPTDQINISYQEAMEKTPPRVMPFPKTKKSDKIDVDRIHQEVVSFALSAIGDNPAREGLRDTPKRVVKSWGQLYAGYGQKIEDILTTFSADGYDQIILLKDIELYSMCEHHMLPFIGKAHVAYLPDPNGKIVGISKLARLVNMYAKRLQIQERIGKQVTEALMKHLQPLGAVCIIETQHLCMKMRGVEKQNSIMTTSSITGVFRDNPALKTELMQMIKG